MAGILRTRTKENMIQLTNNHWPTEKGMATQPLTSVQFRKIWLVQVFVLNMVTAVKISET